MQIQNDQSNAYNIQDNPTLFALPAESVLIVMGTKAGKELKLTGDIKVEQKMEAEPNGQIPQRYGLVNINNTCYMNAAIQLLRSIPELNKELKTFPNPTVLYRSITGSKHRKSSRKVFKCYLQRSIEQRFHS